MGGRAGKAVFAWIGENPAPTVFLGLVGAWVSFCWGNVASVPVIRSDVDHLVKDHAAYVAEHTKFATENLKDIHDALASIDDSINQLKRNDAARIETLRLMEESLREIREAVLHRRGP